MPDTLKNLSPQQAWQPLPDSAWDEAAACHLLNRVGWTATPAEISRAVSEGLMPTLQRLFGRPSAFPKPELIKRIEQDERGMADRARSASDPEKRRALQQENRERNREATTDMTLQWLQIAARPENAAFEKWLLFLQDVWVVAAPKVRNSALLWQHQYYIRNAALATYPKLARLMSRSPAMVIYLDMQQSHAGAANENFARELFELFTLGEGHYTEKDIKEAARAFTGYKQRDGEFFFLRRDHDDGVKNVFGENGVFSGDDIIELIFKQPAAGTFLPREMGRFYLSEHNLPEEYLAVIGASWANTGYDMGKLLASFFSSRLFFAEDFRGNFVKSPLQFYLGLVQDLELTPAPLARQVLGSFRQMGQVPFMAPNVRGWVGGRYWINSATLSARRGLVTSLLEPFNTRLLNADERYELDIAEANRLGPFTLPNARLDEWARLPAEQAANELVSRFLPRQRTSALVSQLAAHIADTSGKTPGTARNGIRTALTTLLQSPGYQLC